jgi:hypothetical protein
MITGRAGEWQTTLGNQPVNVVFDDYTFRVFHGLKKYCPQHLQAVLPFKSK